MKFLRYKDHFVSVGPIYRTSEGAVFKRLSTGEMFKVRTRESFTEYFMMRDAIHRGIAPDIEFVGFIVDSADWDRFRLTFHSISLVCKNGVWRQGRAEMGGLSLPESRKVRELWQGFRPVSCERMTYLGYSVNYLAITENFAGFDYAMLLQYVE